MSGSKADISPGANEVRRYPGNRHEVRKSAVGWAPPSLL